MTQRLYHDDPYLLEFRARVLARSEHAGRPAVVLDRTAFYAESGGQPWDTGSLNEVPVVAVIEEEGQLLHVLEDPLAADEVVGRVDADRRRDHREQHHGQHLLSRALLEVAGARTLSFHLGGELSNVDLDREPTDAQLRDAERRANEAIWSALPVRVVEASVADCRARGIEPPPQAGEWVRLVEAEGFDVQPCGGTHPRTTAEVGVVLVLGRERFKGGARVRFVCGHRALDAFRARAAVLDRLGALFSARFAELPQAAERSLAELTSASRRLRDARLQLVGAEAERLLAEASASPAVVVAVYEGWSADELRSLAQAVVARRESVALLASRGDRVLLCFAQSTGLGHDIPALLRDVAGALGGKGGGKGDLAQGSGERSDALAAALARAADAVRGR
jgi:alanyl-tRNA synthetase